MGHLGVLMECSDKKIPKYIIWRLNVFKSISQLLPIYLLPEILVMLFAQSM